MPLEVRPSVTREILPLLIGKRTVEIPFETRGEVRDLLTALVELMAKLPGDGEGLLALIATDDDGVIQLGEPEPLPQRTPGSTLAAAAAGDEAATPVAVIYDLLTVAGVSVTPGCVEDWTGEQREQAARWAAAEHLHASDNSVWRLPVPPHVTVAAIGAKRAAVLIGRKVEDAHDDSPCPAVGEVVGQIDDEHVKVVWGDALGAISEPIDALRPARGEPPMCPEHHPATSAPCARLSGHPLPHKPLHGSEWGGEAHHAAVTGEPRCEAYNDSNGEGRICNAQKYHGGTWHLMYGDDGMVAYRWPVADDYHPGRWLAPAPAAENGAAT